MREALRRGLRACSRCYPHGVRAVVRGETMQTAEMLMVATQVLCSNCGQPWGARRWTREEIDAEPKNGTSSAAPRTWRS